MNYKIVSKDAYSYVGKKLVLKPDDDPYAILPEFADEVVEDGTHDRINDLVGNPHGTLLDGVFFDFKPDGTKSYMFAAVLDSHIDSSQQSTTSEDMVILKVPPLTWAVFSEHGRMPDQIAVKKIWSRVYTEWFPTSEYEAAPGPCVEKYIWEDNQNISYRCEVWIPVIKKSLN